MKRICITRNLSKSSSSDLSSLVTIVKATTLLWLLALVAMLFMLEIVWGPAGFDLHVVEIVRLPRAEGALLAGVLLAVAGLVMQTVLRNPLADPYLLGVSGVAQLTAVISYVLWRMAGAPYVGYFTGAMLGAAGATLLLLFLSRRVDLLVVLMTGVLMSFVSFSAIQVVLVLLPPEELGYVYLGLQGNFAAFPAGLLGYALATVAVAVYAAVYAHARHIAALAHGEEAAAGLGADVKRASAVALVATSVAVGVVAASVGPIGFIGLLAPHMARWIAGRHRFDKVLWYAAALGPALALAADLAVRLMPREIPVNTVLTLIGAPVAAYLMWRYVGGIRG
mgnify:CR=1 FL=1